MNKPPIRFFHSLTFKFYITAAVFVLSLLSVNLLLNTFAFSDYYRGQKQTSLVQSYKDLNELSENREELIEHLQGRAADTPSLLLWNEFQVLYRDRSIPLFDNNAPFLSLSLTNLFGG